MVPLQGWSGEDVAVENLTDLGAWASACGLVQVGRVDIEGEDEERWSYAYGPDGVRQVSINGAHGAGQEGERTAVEDDGHDLEPPPPPRTSWLRRLLGGWERASC